MKCGYEHHEPGVKAEGRADMGRCAKGHELKCGPFHHAVCPECDGSMSRPCRTCNSPVYECCC